MVVCVCRCGLHLAVGFVYPVFGLFWLYFGPKNTTRNTTLEQVVFIPQHVAWKKARQAKLQQRSFWFFISFSVFVRMMDYKIVLLCVIRSTPSKKKQYIQH
jgi:hypothetical protein